MKRFLTTLVAVLTTLVAAPAALAQAPVAPAAPPPAAAAPPAAPIAPSWFRPKAVVLGGISLTCYTCSEKQHKDLLRGISGRLKTMFGQYRSGSPILYVDADVPRLGEDYLASFGSTGNYYSDNVEISTADLPTTWKGFVVAIAEQIAGAISEQEAARSKSAGALRKTTTLSEGPTAGGSVKKPNRKPAKK